MVWHFDIATHIACVHTWSLIPVACQQSYILLITSTNCTYTYSHTVYPKWKSSELTIIIPDGDVCLIKVWSHYNSWLAAGISKGDLELFISLHNELICHWNVDLDSGLTSRDGHLCREFISREIDTSSWGEWEAGDSMTSQPECLAHMFLAKTHYTSMFFLFC